MSDMLNDATTLAAMLGAACERLQVPRWRVAWLADCDGLYVGVGVPVPVAHGSLVETVATFPFAEGRDRERAEERISAALERARKLARERIGD